MDSYVKIPLWDYEQLKKDAQKGKMMSEEIDLEVTRRLNSRIYELKDVRESYYKQWLKAENRLIHLEKDWLFRLLFRKRNLD